MAKRILIADDSVTIQKAFAMTFAGEDVTLVAARSADEGLTIAQRTRPDLVIADGVMPGRSGYDLCHAIKSDPGLRGVPVYILTSLHNPLDEARARQSAADGEFTKPFESVAIVAGVQEALAKSLNGLGAATAAPPGVDLHGAPSLVDDYGEITVGGSGIRAGAAVSPIDEDVATPPPAPSAPSAAPARPVAHPGSAAAPPGMRPSLIPGMRPGLPVARPGTVPSRPAVGSAQPVPHAAAVAPSPLRPPAPQPPPVIPGGMRTMMGLPAAGLQPPPRGTAPSYPVAPPPPAPTVRAAAPAMAPAEARTPPPVIPGGLAGQVASVGASRVADQMAAISARGPEYEAIAKLSRETIERIVREIVPQLAEAIVREELHRRGRI